MIFKELGWSGRVDSNHRPPGPEPGALARLSHAPKTKSGTSSVYHRPRLQNVRRYQAHSQPRNRVAPAPRFIRHRSGRPPFASPLARQPQPNRLR